MSAAEIREMLACMAVCRWMLDPSLIQTIWRFPRKSTRSLFYAARNAGRFSWGKELWFT